MNTKYESLKDHRIEAISALLDNDKLAVLPTGYGQKV